MPEGIFTPLGLDIGTTLIIRVTISNTSYDVIVDIISVYRIVNQIKGKRYDFPMRNPMDEREFPGPHNNTFSKTVQTTPGL